jgi:hypothetical protein
MQIQLTLIIIPVFELLSAQTVFVLANVTNDIKENVAGNYQQVMPTPIVVGFIALLAGIVTGVVSAILKLRSDRKIELLKQHRLDLNNVEQQYRLDLVYLNQRQRLETECDIDLRTRRIEAYKQLWSEQYHVRTYLAGLCR